MLEKGDRSIVTRGRDSLRGLSEGWRRERALRTHVAFSLVGLGVLTIADVGLSWRLAVFLLVAAGISAELINGSIEATSKAFDVLRLSDKNLRYLIQDKAHRVYINKKLQKKETICARKCISL